MASLSLPRVLQLKKNSLDAEREQFEKFQSLAINKAINSIETPVKEKHVRSTIIGTFQEQSAITYWMVAIRLPLQDNRIVAWKFCHVTHKLLREGHPACLDDSQRHIGMIENLGKLWVHLREGYGRLVHLYCNLLVTKLKFHARNPRFPGNMQLTADELDNIAENDVNNYFQLCVELFDYMDEILNLQSAVFDSLGNARANSMTASGQCRLAALIPCAQDSSHIYDCNVRLLFRLHAALPADTLAGHRERFRVQFKKLSQFYKHASSLQYYRNLLTLPVLPAHPPNFLLQSDFGTYVTPVVSIPEPVDEPDAVGSLVDTSDTISQATTPEQFDAFDTRTTPSPQPDPIVERDRLIDHLQNELRRMRSEVTQLVQERNTMMSSMREHCTRIETQLQTAKTELEEEKQKAEILSTQTPEIKQRLAETEEKAKVTDEKFQKLKGAYTQLREEHITLIRQKAEVDKMTASLRAAAAQHENAKAALQQQLNDRMKDVELLQQSASASEEVEAYKSELVNLRTELEQSRQKEAELETLKASMESLEIEHKTATAELEEKLNKVTYDLKEVTETLETIRREKEDKENELNRVKVELVGLKEKTGEEYKKAIEEKEAALKQVEELKQQHQQEKEEQSMHANNLQIELEALEIKLFETQKSYEARCAQNNKEFNDTLVSKNAEIEEAMKKTEKLQIELKLIAKLHEEKLSEKQVEVSRLEDKINELILLKSVTESTLKNVETERDTIKTHLKEITNDKQSLEMELSEKQSEISNLSDLIKSLQELQCTQKLALDEMQNSKFVEVSKLQQQIQTIIQEKDNQIIELQKELQDNIEFGNMQKSEEQNLLKNISDLENCISFKNKEVETLLTKLYTTGAELEESKVVMSTLKKENECKIQLLEEKLQSVTDSKNEVINNLKSLLAEKDEQVISLNIDLNKLSADKLRLEEELNETNAELEIGKNELLRLKEEHEYIIQQNEENLKLKNYELKNLHDEVNVLQKSKTGIILEKETLLNDSHLEKQVLEKKLKDAEEIYAKKSWDYDVLQNEKIEVTNKLNAVIDEIQTEFQQYKDSKEIETKYLTKTFESTEKKYIDEIREQEEIIETTKNKIGMLNNQLNELQNERMKEKEDLEEIVCNKDKEIQMLESRLEHAEGTRLTAECELQDLLQHNTVLEADLAAAKRQLQEAKKEIETQACRVVTASGETALQVTEEALAALEQGSAHEAGLAAAQRAQRALEQLAHHTQMKGNEELIARSALLAAHNAAALSAYVADVCNTSTDIDKADKLSSECRAMLAATKQCVECVSLGDAGWGAGGAAARALVAGVARAAAAGAEPGGARTVDDELADMDRAIEGAALQIEEMLKASRAGDTGVKLEVNEKILDACTTLMAAVKVLVQDARGLQQELGDPGTRQKMYRRNPQWSEGLISAAKAVVFAAKLLVSSADEAVGAAGRVEGVSAAAHEVAGSTAQLVAASRARAPPAAPALARLTHASRAVAAATGAVVAAVRAGAALVHEQEALDTSALTLTATRRLEMESKVRALELETALTAERTRLAALRKRHYQLAQLEENGNMTNGKQ